MSDEIKVTPKSAPVETETTEEPAAQATDAPPIDSSVARLELAQYLGVRDIANDRFQFVCDRLTQNGSGKGDVFQTVRDIEHKLGLPRYGLGESRLGILYNYLKAEYAVSQATKVKNSFLA